MLLTCKSCGNTYVIDDAEWASADGDGKICEQCQEPLVPLVAGGAQQDSTTILEGYSFDGIQSSMQGGGAPGGGGPMNQPPSFGPGAESYGDWQSPTGSMSASVPMPPDHGSMAQPPPGYSPPPAYNPSQQGPPGGFGPPPGMGGGYGPPPGMNDPYGGGNQAPMPTQALDGLAPGAPPPAGGEGSEQYIGSNESTMALDLDDLRSDAAPVAPLPATQALDPVGGPPPGVDPNEATGALDTSALQRGRGRKQLIIGGGGGPAAPSHDDRTAAIDLNQASAYAAQMQSATPGPGGWGGGGPGAMQQQAQAQAQRPRQIPGVRPMQPQTPIQTGSGGGVVKVVLIIALVLLVIGGGVGAAVYFLGGDDRKSSASGGSDEADEPLTFEERLAEARSATTVLLPPISGRMPADGQIVLASADGAFVGKQLVVPFSGQQAPADQLEKGVYMPALVTALSEADATMPIVVLLDSSLSMSAAFPLLYTASSTGRQVFVGGSTIENPNSVGTVELNPWEWPDPPAGEFASPTRKTELRVIVTSGEIRLEGKGVNDNGEGDANKLTLTWFELSKVPAALASAKSANSDLDAVRMVPSPDLTVGKLIEAVQVVRGENYDLPRFQTLYLEPPK